jgi:hypothetical protein
MMNSLPDAPLFTYPFSKGGEIVKPDRQTSSIIALYNSLEARLYHQETGKAMPHFPYHRIPAGVYPVLDMGRE